MDHAKAANQLTQLSQELGMYDTKMDNAMADIQADDMKHGLYDEPMDSVKRAGLEHSIAAKLLDVVSQDDLEDSYYEMQLEWAESMPDNELMQTARDLGIEF